jgi:hypothetical protein
VCSDCEKRVAGENTSEMVDERGRLRGTEPALPLDGISDGARERGALEFELHQNVLSAVAEQSIREVFVRLVGQNQDGSAAGAGIHFEERIEQGRAIGQAEIEQDGVERIGPQAVQSVREPIDRNKAGSAPVGPQAVLFNLEQGFAQKMLVFERVLYQQESEGFRIAHSE